MKLNIEIDCTPAEARAFLGKARLSAGLPPALVVTAGFDPLKDEGRDYAARLTAAGNSATHVEYAGLVHDFYIMPDVSPAGVRTSMAVTSRPPSQPSGRTRARPWVPGRHP